MKTLFVILWGLMLGGIVQAQGSMQFNQALLLESSASSCTGCWTVPAGKVWKITGISGNSSNAVPLYINGKELGFISPYSSNSLNFNYLTVFPIWLPAGSILGFSNLGSNRNAAFWGIEFNVVP
jgi:hypothetical protein